MFTTYRSEPNPRLGSDCGVSANTIDFPLGCSDGVEGALCGGRSTMRPKVRAVLASASSPPGYARMNDACVPTPGATGALDVGGFVTGWQAKSRHASAITTRVVGLSTRVMR